MTISQQNITKLKYAIYTRVSTDEQENENQLIRILQYAKKHKLTYDVYKEIESSSNNRPIKNKIIKYIKQGKYQGIIIYKLDRWGRSYSELINDEKLIIENKIDFISVTENINLKTSSGRLYFHILASFAEYEKLTIKERTIDGLNRTKANGTVLGRPRGSKDTVIRNKVNYILREKKKRAKSKKNKLLKSK
jgi:DNA invertase Pin-like site-specific DNA recombinase